eukprot:scaffold179579_cov30-Tisochrysis_lutea.AAC.2
MLALRWLLHRLERVAPPPLGLALRSVHRVEIHVLLHLRASLCRCLAALSATLHVPLRIYILTRGIFRLAQIALGPAARSTGEVRFHCANRASTFLFDLSHVEDGGRGLAAPRSG